MFIKKDYIKIVSVLLTIFFMFTLVPFSLKAQTQPWDPYAQYLPEKTPVVKRHLRGTWISTVINLDWPSSNTAKIQDEAERIQKSKEELIAILNKAAEMNMNAVFLQVSPEGDALYKSDIVPWSRYLTGSYGKDPGFDPLAFAVEEAHKRCLEIHAWFNPYRVSMDTKAATVSSLAVPKSVYKEHPEWIKTSMSRFVVDPGIPEARAWVMDRVMEVVNNYDIDGIHFDDYFYNENYEGEMKDNDTYSKYNKGQFTNLGDWRRNNNYLLVSELSKKIRFAKSWVKFGVSPGGVWGNKKDGHLDGSDTTTSYTNYERSFADTKKWVEEELIDYIAPQIYFTFANPRAPYGELATWWSNVCKDKKVQLYIGQALYKINDDTDSYFTGQNALPEFKRQLTFNITKPEIAGSILFRVQNVNDIGKQQVISAMKSDIWSTRALVPVMSWKGGKAPTAPVQGKMEALTGGCKLTWADNDPATVYYAVYRFAKGEKADITSETSAAKLIATVKKNSSGAQNYTDFGYQNPGDGFYVVTALDRLHTESSGLTIRWSLSRYFPDIGEEYVWAADAIDALYDKEIIKGDNRGLFNPGQNTKRGDFILMTIRAFDIKAEFNKNFADVPKGSYYYDAIGIAKQVGLARGIGGELFKPGDAITRQDIMVLVARVLEIMNIPLEEAGKEVLEGYQDTHLISGYAADAVARLTKAGIVQGTGGYVNPGKMATRAEIAVILQRVMNYIKGLSM